MKTILFAATFGMLGCGVQGLQSVKGQKVYVDGVPLDAVAAAVAMWNDAVGIDLAITDDPRISSITVASVTDDCGSGPGGNTYVGYDDEGTTMAAICMGHFPDPSDPLLRAVVAHELGHVMDMHHVPIETPALMNHTVLPESAITDSDVVQFRARWGMP